MEIAALNNRSLSENRVVTLDSKRPVPATASVGLLGFWAYSQNLGRIMQLKFFKLSVSTLILFSINEVYAASASVKIRYIVPDYMPDQIRLKTDSDIGQCTRGMWLDRFGNGADQSTKRENNTVAYSTLLAALMSGKKVNVFVDDTNCQITNLQFSNE